VDPSATLTPVVRKQFVILGLTGLAKHGLSVPVREDTLATPWLHAGVGSVLTMQSVLATLLVLTTSARTHARDRQLHVG